MFLSLLSPLHTHKIPAGRLWGLLFLCCTLTSTAQEIRTINPFAEDDRFPSDSTELTGVPTGIYAWTIEPRFGDIRPADYDTIPHHFPNEAFTSGVTGQYNYTGNLGAPRISRLFSQQESNAFGPPFIFFRPYDFFIPSTGQLLFTNTKSPFTNITYHECGNKQNGEDRIKARFSVNSGKKLGMGFLADYLYGRGYYEGQSTAHFNGTIFSSYKGENYQMHLYAQHLQLKTRENGGIENDDYVTRPESFPTSYGTADMPINLARAWNKMYSNTVYLTHRYSLGFRRYRDAKGNIVKRDRLPKSFGVVADTLQNDKQANATTLPATPKPATPPTALATDSAAVRQATPRLPRGVHAKGEEEQATPDSLKITTEFVPVSSFIHTLRISDSARRFLSNESNTPDNPGYFADFYLPGDSANDYTHNLTIENTLALEMHEGFNRWMKMGLRLFAKHQFANFTLPDEQRRKIKYSENYLTLGGQLLKQQGRILHYDVLGEIRTSGSDWGEFNVEANADLHIPLPKDSLHFEFHGFVRNERPSFYFRHYHARNAWWDNNSLSKVFTARIGATLRYKRTSLTATLQNVQNHLYFAERLTPYESSDGFTAYRHSVSVAQAGHGTQALAITLGQDFKWGILNWENELTYQASSNADVLPLPAFTAYTNLYLLFRIAKVLRTEFGADLRYFTRYKAPAYSPLIGQYAIQDANYSTSVGNYPIINAYVNFHLKRTRFYLMASHVNYSSGNGEPFLVPHYPLNRMVIRFGVSWNFIN